MVYNGVESLSIIGHARSALLAMEDSTEMQ